MPGCQILVAKDGNVVINKSYGLLGRGERNSNKVEPDCIYDLASMSKVCGTLAALMKTYDDGLWSFEDKVADFIPETADKAVGSLRMEQLLYHKSGLPSGLRMFELLLDTATYTGEPFKYKSTGPYTVKVQKGVYGHRDAKIRRDLYSTVKSDSFPLPVAKGIYASLAARDTIMNRIYAIEPSKNKKYRYSDLNFCLLMKIVENITGQSMDSYLDENVYGPLGMNHTFYTPLEYYPLDKIVPTETDNFLRRQQVRGYVHDETAAFSGGLQGNAGLFSNVDDLSRLCQTWLNGGVYAGIEIFKPETVELFTTAKANDCDRFPGFDNLVSKKDWGVSESTYGHTGFTGTCFWIDSENGIVYIFLSNRVHPSRDNSAFTKFNPRYSVLKEVYDAIK